MSTQLKWDEVPSILPRDWDPLGIGDNPNLSDEYDAHIPELIRLLGAGESAYVIAAYFWSIENRRGVIQLPEKAMEIAVRLSGNCF